MIPERLSCKIRYTDGCDTWVAALNDKGYGNVWDPRTKKVVKAHRLLYELLVGPIPKDMTIDHTCHVPAECEGGDTCPHRACVKVAHMELVTAAENARRGWRAKLRNTSCPQGHPYSGDNLYIQPNGGRKCKRCILANQRAYRKRRRDAGLAHG